MEHQDSEPVSEFDDEYRRLHAAHSDYERRLMTLARKPHLSEEEQLEEKRLKKQKLFPSSRRRWHHHPNQNRLQPRDFPT